MKNEEFKKTLNYSQKSVFEALEKQITDAIKRHKNELAAIELLAYCPKKDGTPKKNFGMNFGLVDPWGESFKVNRWNGVETERFVDVWFGHSLISNERRKIEFKFKPYYNDNKGTDPKPATNFEYFNGTIYFGWQDFDKWAGFDTQKEAGKMDAEFVYRAIKEFYAGVQRGRLEGYERELKELPKWFKRFIDEAERIQKLMDDTSEMSFIHSFVSQNFDSRDVYSLHTH